MPFCHVTLRGRRPLPKAYPRSLQTLGDHLRGRRLDLGLLQREVAGLLAVDAATVTNWEVGRTAPALRFLPRILRFLGSAPSAPSRSLPERLRVRRRTLGLSQGELARRLEVDESTLACWERGTRRPSKVLLDRLQVFLEPRLRSGPSSTNPP